MSAEPRLKNSDNKFRKKVRAAIGKSKRSKDGDDDALYLDMNKKSGEEGVGRKKSFKLRNESKLGLARKRNMKSSAEEKGYQVVTEGNSGRKRKRIYADKDIGKERAVENNVETHNRKSSSKRMENRVRYDSGKTQLKKGAKSYAFEEADKDVSIEGGRKSKGSKFLDKKKSRGEVRVANKGKVEEDNVETRNRKSSSKRMENRVRYDSGKTQLKKGAKSYAFEEEDEDVSIEGGRKSKGSKLLDKKKSRGEVRVANKGKVEEDNGYNSGGILKRNTKIKYLSTEKLDQGQRKQLASVEKPHKKMFQSKKNSTGDTEVIESRPKKKKKGIRIDPHDISNKRLDDGLESKDNREQNKDSTEKNDAEISKNAQFRAIRPSPSILSFVEDNLLGRRREIEFSRAGYNIELSAPLDNIPSSTSTERERIEVPVFRNKLTFFAAAKVSSSFPPPEYPEIAFAGRSNVGKSSLLNALTRQWGVVRTSDKPGLTQTINFFKLEPKLHLVDLPGYGFAYAKEEVKEEWEALVKEYVSTRVGLKRVCLLIDTKWGMKPRDHELIDLMERSQTKYQIVLTKTDLVFPIDVARRAMQIEESLKAKKSAVQPVMMISSKTGAGIRSLRTALANIVRFVKR